MVHLLVQLVPLVALLAWGVRWWLRRRRGDLGRDPERPREPFAQRFGRGWREAARTAGMARRSGSLVALPLTASAIGAVGYVALLALTGRWTHPLGARLFLASLIALYPFSLLGGFAGVAFLASVDARLQGRPASIRDGLALAWRKRGPIALWALLSAGVGAVLQLLQHLRSEWLLAPLAGWLAGAAWSVVSMFALPVLALEDLPVRRIAGRAGSLARRRWGEGVGGMSALALVWMPLLFLVGIAAGVIGGLTSPATAVVAVIAALFACIMLMSVQQQLLSLAVYRFAVDGRAIGGFDEDELERALQPRR